MARFGDVTVEIDNHVALVEVHRPPHNFFSLAMLGNLADAFEAVDGGGEARCIVLASEGKNFCAGAELKKENPQLTSAQEPPSDPPPAVQPAADASARDSGGTGERHIYDEAVRLFSVRTPAVSAVQGAAVGGGLGLACMTDFRVGGPGSRLTANFARLGFHQGFGLSVTLPSIIGNQAALELLYTGRRINGEEAARIGLLDRFVPDDQIRSAALELAAEIAGSAPLALRSIKETMRGHLPREIRAATDRERQEQERLTTTEDWAEGVRAMAERRAPDFKGR